MSKNATKDTTYTEAPQEHRRAMEEGRRISRPEWLPSPEVLAKRNRNHRITLNVTEYSLSVIKQWADQVEIPYQTLLKGIITEYAMMLVRDGYVDEADDHENERI